MAPVIAKDRSRGTGLFDQAVILATVDQGSSLKTATHFFGHGRVIRLGVGNSCIALRSRCYLECMQNERTVG